MTVLAIATVTGCGGDPSGGTAAGGASASSPVGTAAPVGTAELLPAGRAYVEAVNNGDLDALVAAFTADGTVVDVSRRITGHGAIRTWAEREVIGGRLEVVTVSPMPGGQDVLVHWAPEGAAGWRAHYRFTYSGDRLAVADLQYA
ncbi:nuclear transport factor 2 family protein [Micromonospora sp. NPDC049559]|uniref:nuclear transport factor 2 family protein n=1 Tax=Micromonospora sp. NPDC049559 TaxID=3155923 RepID=UPI00343C732E